MHFEQGHIYHIFNQGNNRDRIFFKRENYLFFLRKMRTHILPFGDILAYCLMPNHFHIMMVVNETEMLFTRSATQIHTPSRSFYSECDLKSRPELESTQIHAPSKMQKTNINKEIGILLASYTRAINKEQKLSGSLFRQKTKAECLTCNKGITPSFFNTNYGTKINIPRQEKQYPQACFDYIHHNPVKAGLVKRAIDWEFSSYRDYCGKRNGTLINKNATKEFGIIYDLE
ncbi:MAG: transposase [bacterium]